MFFSPAYFGGFLSQYPKLLVLGVICPISEFLNFIYQIFDYGSFHNIEMFWTSEGDFFSFVDILLLKILIEK